MKLLWRLWLLLGLFFVVALIAVPIRRIGLGEFAVVLAFFVLAFSVEGARYVVGRFLREYRGGKDEG